MLRCKRHDCDYNSVRWALFGGGEYKFTKWNLLNAMETHIDAHCMEKYGWPDFKPFDRDKQITGKPDCPSFMHHLPPISDRKIFGINAGDYD